MNHGTELGGKACGGEARKRFVHDGDGTDLFFGEFVRALKVVDFDFAGIGGGLKDLRLGISGIDCGE
jgi:hypothetical protein